MLSVVINVRGYRGVCDMYDDLIKNRLVVELKKLVDNASKDSDDVDSYIDFMREMILNTYSTN